MTREGGRMEGELTGPIFRTSRARKDHRKSRAFHEDNSLRNTRNATLYPRTRGRPRATIYYMVRKRYLRFKSLGPPSRLLLPLVTNGSLGDFDSFHKNYPSTRKIFWIVICRPYHFTSGKISWLLMRRLTSGVKIWRNFRNWVGAEIPIPSQWVHATALTNVFFEYLLSSNEKLHSYVSFSRNI